MKGVVYVGNGTYRRISQVTGAARAQPPISSAALPTDG